MSRRWTRPFLILTTLAFGCGDGCSPPPEEIACPGGSARDSRQGDLCVCKDRQGQLVSTIHGLSYPACDPSLDTRDAQGGWHRFDIFADTGQGQLTPVGSINTEVFCAVDAGNEPVTYLERDETSCQSCDCESFDGCIPGGCRRVCGDTRQCAPGQTCLANGTCAECGFAPGQIQCGGGPDGCGSCPADTMCIEGFCSAVRRCVISPGFCDVPEWCPLDIRPSPQNPSGYSPLDGEPCYCLFPRESPCNSFQGRIAD